MTPRNQGIQVPIRILLFLILPLSLLLCAERLNSHFGFYRIEQPVSLETSDVEAGHVFRGRVAAKISMSRITPNQVILVTDGADHALFTPDKDSVYSVKRGLFTILGPHEILFSPDNATRFDQVAIRYPLTFNEETGVVIERTWAGSAIIFLVCIFLHFGTEKTTQIIRNSLDFIGRYPSAFLFVPSLYFLLTYTPLWKGGDANCQLIFPAGATNILHFPPLYCFLARVPICIGDILEALCQHRPLPAFNLFSQQHPSLAGVWLLILLQQVGLVAALNYFLRQTTRNYVARGMLVLVFLPCSSLYSEAHSAGTEALSQILLFFFAGVVISVFRAPTKRYWFAYFAVLVLAILTRHINLILVVWAPLGFLVKMALDRLTGGAPDESNWRSLVLGTMLGLLAIMCANVVQRVAVIPTGVPYRSTLGGTLSDRIGAFLHKLAPESRDQLVRSLAEKDRDRWVKRAIELQGEMGGYYQGMGESLGAELKRTGVRSPDLEKQVDDTVLKSGVAFLSSLHPMLIDTIRRDFLKGFTRSGNYEITQESFDSVVLGGVDQDRHPDSWRALSDIPNLDLPTATALADRVQANGYFGITRHIHIVVIVVLASIFSLYCLLSGRKSVAIVAMSALTTGAAIQLASCIVEFFGRRYTIPLHLFALIGLCLALAATVENWERSLFGPRAKGCPGTPGKKPESFAELCRRQNESE
jgi:hypothetical protein